MSPENTASIFERASRLKLRFETHRGFTSIEELWDIPLESRNDSGYSLDDIARGLHQRIKASAEESFVAKQTKVAEELQLGFDIVKHVIDVKLAERDARVSAAEKKALKEKLLERIAKKQDEALDNKSEAELREMVEAL